MVGVLALVVFGPDKLPEMLKTAGKTLGEFRRISSSVKQEFKEGLLDEDEKVTPAAKIEALKASAVATAAAASSEAPDGES
jgi:TatA/E family protein of Tat protein translocase